MNYTKDNPVGVDYAIDRIQKVIYPILEDKWGVVDVHGRVYSNARVVDGEQVFELERYVGNGQYEPVTFSEGNKVFFIQDNEVELSFGKANNSIWVVAIVNLDDISSEFHRADEEAHVDMISALHKAVPASDVVEIQYGIENFQAVANEVFSNSNFIFGDIHPNHIFITRIEVSYNLIEVNC